MSDRPQRTIPGQLARRIAAENQARGQRARTHLERARKRHRQALARDARRGRGERRSPAGLRRLVAAGGFALSILAGALFGGALLELFGAWGPSESARIEQIAVQGNRLLGSRDIAAATGVQPGQPRAEITPAEVGARLRAHPWIEDADVMWLPTGKLLVRVDEREPVAMLGSGEAGSTAGWRWIDASGTPFARGSAAEPEALRGAAANDWPRLRGGEALEDGRAHPELLAALTLHRWMQAEGIARLLDLDGPLELRLPEPGDPEGWVIETGPGRPRVILGGESIHERLAHLETLLRSDVDALRGATEIDLRFADQAVLRGGTAASG